MLDPPEECYESFPLLEVAVRFLIPNLPAMARSEVEQAIFSAGRVSATSAGIDDEAVSELRRVIAEFGSLSADVETLYVVHLWHKRTAVFQARGSRCRVMVIPRRVYADLHDPFFIHRACPPDFEQRGHLPTLVLMADQQPNRDLNRVKDVLCADDSATLLGAAQALVDGGRVAFERTAPDAEILERLWALLPASDRASLSVATYAPAQSLPFDLMATPAAPPGYLSDSQAGDYPEGRYELALQLAAETDDAARLEDLFARRSGSQAFRFACGMLIAAFALGLAVRWIPWEKLR